VGIGQIFYDYLNKILSGDFMAEQKVIGITTMVWGIEYG